MLFRALIILIICASFCVCRISEIHAQEPNVWGGENVIEAIESTGLSKQDIRVTIAKIIRGVLAFLGIIAVLIIIYAGFLWMTAGGNADRIEQSKKLMINAGIGLVIILSSFAIVSFVLKFLIGAMGGSSGGIEKDSSPSSPFPPNYQCADPALSGGCALQDQSCLTQLATTPYVCQISPKSKLGPPGTYVTISGFHFDEYLDGASKVEFYNQTVSQAAEIVICPGTGRASWSDNRIVAKVPDVAIGSYFVRVIDKDGTVNKIENHQSFSIIEGEVPPGIACIIPDEGKEGQTEVEIYGDYFGEAKTIGSEAVFFEEKLASVAEGDWTLNKIKTVVPIGAITGDLVIRVKNGEEEEEDQEGKEGGEGILESNGYLFKVMCVAHGDCASGCCYRSAYCVDFDECAGESCDINLSTADCEAGNCAAPLLCGEGCICKRPGIGDSCDSNLSAAGCQKGQCDAGLVCGDDCFCKQPPGLGELCDIDLNSPGCQSGSCSGNLVCDIDCFCREFPGPGEACRTETSDCSNGQCNTASICDQSDCLCKPKPIINWISPDNGASGNLITIGGINFGVNEGDVMFIAGETKVKAKLAGEINGSCAFADWTDTRIIAEAPSGLTGTAEIQVIASSGFSSENKNFNFNNIIRPGLCSAYVQGNLEKHEGKFKDLIDLAGVNLLSVNSIEEIIFGDETKPYSGPNAAAGTELIISGVGLPNLAAGRETSIRVKEGSEFSNPVEFGIVRYDAMPRISHFNPEAGHPGDYVTIYGENFGASQGQVLFGETAAGLDFPDECLDAIWSDKQVVVKAPAGSQEGNYLLKVITAEGLEITSGEDKFYIGDYCENDYKPCPEEEGEEDGCETAGRGICVKNVVPGLCKIMPDNGHKGTEVSFFGENFGASAGRVKFNVDAGEGEEGVTEPKNWELGLEGKADKAVAEVPKNPLPGDIRVISADNSESNGMNFEIKNCLTSGEAACPGKICCGEGSYYAGSCMATLTECGEGTSGPTDYIWSFTTKLPTLTEQCSKLNVQNSCQSSTDAVECCWEEVESGECRANGKCSGQSIPYVLEECAQKGATECLRNAGGPSPSPWAGHNTGEACVDSLITAKFSEEMDNASYADAIEARKCETCDTCVFDENKCSENIFSASGLTPILLEGIEFKPSNNLIPNTWYQVALDGAKIKSAKGIYLDGDKDGSPQGKYNWNFKVRNDSNFCQIGCPLVEPSKYISHIKEEKVSYFGSFTAQDNRCSILKDRGELWNWSSNDGNKAEVVADSLCSNCSGKEAKCGCVNVKNETGSIPVTIVGDFDGKPDYGLLYIDFLDFNVIDHAPACDSACLNAGVWAKLNSPIEASTIDDNNVVLYKCLNDNCTSYEAISIGGAINNDTITIYPRSADNNDLLPNNFYRAVINGWENGIRNLAGGTLSGLNYSAAANNKIINPGFESSAGWEYNAGERTANKSHSGQYSAVLIGKPSELISIYHNAVAIRVEKDKRYQFSGWIYNSLESGEAHIELKDMNQNKICAQETSSTNWKRSWEQSTCSFIAPETKNLFVFLIADKAAGYVWFDDLEFIQTDAPKDSFSWVFKTSGQKCELDRVELNPLDGYVAEIGASLPYSAIPFSVSDKCSANGQRLNAFSYNWQWATSTLIVADYDVASISKYPLCGNGILELGEECEARGEGGEGCNDSCLHIGTSKCALVTDFNCCGNGIVEAGEDCDEWKIPLNPPLVKEGSGCSEICLNKGSNALYGSSCGNGTVELGEDCDDGNVQVGNGCGANCLKSGTANAGSGYAHYQLVTAENGPEPFAGSGDGSQQYQSTVGIQALAEGKTGEGNFTIVCGYEYGGTQDHKCNVSGSNEKGVAINGCCGIRPDVYEALPADLDNFCLNGAVQATFDQIMDEEQLKNAKILERYNANCDCDTKFWNGTGCQMSITMGSGMVAGEMNFNGMSMINEGVSEIFQILLDVFIGNKLSLFGKTYVNVMNFASSHLLSNGSRSFRLLENVKAETENWCSVESAVIASQVKREINGEDRTASQIYISPDNGLLGNSRYRLNFNGLKNKFGVVIAPKTEADMRKINTAGAVCSIDHVDIFIDPTSPAEPANFDMFTCAGRDDCGCNTSDAKDDDYDCELATKTPGNQHKYTAFAKDEVGRYLVPDHLIWIEKDPNNAIDLMFPAEDELLFNQITAKPLEDAAASIEIGAYGYGSAATSTVEIKVFMCENPWPPFVAGQPWPGTNDNYNFSVYYCRDEGTVNDMTDDLPQMGDIKAICEGSTCAGDSVREYLWVEKDTN